MANLNSVSRTDIEVRRALGELSGGDSPDSEAETQPAAKRAGGPNAGHGSATPPSGNAADASNNGSKSRSSKPDSNGSPRRSPGAVPAAAPTTERTGRSLQAETVYANPSAQYARFQEDAPPCDQCGAITVRSGNCYLCHNCGNSMGCS